MVKKEKFTIRLARSVIAITPRNKILHDLAIMYINKYHNSGNIDMKTNGEYRWLAQCLQSKLSPIVFDVGANVGKWSQAVLDIHPNAIIHAFEPSPTSYPLLAQHPFPANVHINHLGLGDKQGELTFYEYGDAHSHNSLYPRHDKPYVNQTTIQVDTLEHYCAKNQIEHIDFLKIDTEGHDYYVLQGGKSLLEQEKIDVIQFEYGNNYLDARLFLKDMFDLIDDMNYSIYRIMPKHLHFIPKYHEIHERFTYTNYTIVNHKTAQQFGLQHR